MNKQTMNEKRRKDLQSYKSFENDRIKKGITFGGWYDNDNPNRETSLINPKIGYAQFFIKQTHDLSRAWMLLRISCKMNILIYLQMKTTGRKHTTDDFQHVYFTTINNLAENVYYDWKQTNKSLNDLIEKKVIYVVKKEVNGKSITGYGINHRVDTIDYSWLDDDRVQDEEILLEIEQEPEPEPESPVEAKQEPEAKESKAEIIMADESLSNKQKRIKLNEYEARVRMFHKQAHNDGNSKKESRLLREINDMQKIMKSIRFPKIDKKE
jgi:hypothetical protein